LIQTPLTINNEKRNQRDLQNIEPQTCYYKVRELKKRRSQRDKIKDLKSIKRSEKSKLMTKCGKIFQTLRAMKRHLLRLIPRRN